MAIRNTFSASGSKDIPALRRATQQAFQSTTEQINRELVTTEDLNNARPTQGYIEDLGFITEDDAATTFQPQTPENPVVLTSDLSSYLMRSDLPMTVTRDSQFPDHPIDGDITYLTTNLYPPGTATTTSAVPVSATGAGAEAMRQLTVTDPVTNETIVAGTVFVNQANVPLYQTRASRSLPRGTGTTFTRGFVRDRSYDGFHVTRSSTTGTTIISTTVSEVRYGGVTVSFGTNTPILEDAFLYDYHYQQTTRNRAGSSIVQNLHYFSIGFTTPNPDSINTQLTEDNAVSVIEAAIADSSSLEIALHQGNSTPLTFATTSAFTGRPVLLTGYLGSLSEHSTYQFLPLNGFTINRNATNINDLQTITRVIQPDGSINTSPESIYNSAGAVDLVVNTDVEDWDVQFTRTFRGVPTTPTTPTHTTGPHVFQAGTWNRLEYDADAAGNVGGSGLSERTDNLNVFVSAETIANGFGTLPANSGTASWIHTVQVNGEDAVRISGFGIPHSSDADYEFTFTALGSWTLTGSNRDTTSAGLRYNGRDLYIGISGLNPVYATNARIEIFKDIVASSSDFNDFKSKIANL